MLKQSDEATMTDAANSKDMCSQTLPECPLINQVHSNASMDWKPSSSLMDEIFKARSVQKWEEFPRARLEQTERELKDFKAWIIPLRKRIEQAISDIKS